MTEAKRIRVEALTRVEGEGGITIGLRDGVIEEVLLDIFEPPRLFEAFLRGRPLEDTPDITARICGICPIAYQMSAVHALEAALGVAITPEIRQLRRLLYCGEWIESHALHMHLLNAPDFLNAESGIALAVTAPDDVKRGLRLKKHGNELLAVLGGRAIHPVNTAVGGFYRFPRRDELTPLIPDFEWGLQAAVEATRWVAGFSFPEFDRTCEYVALVHPDEYPMNEGQVGSNIAPAIDVAGYEQAFAEQHVPQSTALQSTRTPQGSWYFVGPLARVNLNFERLSPTARRIADEIGFEVPCMNPYRGIIARGLEVIHAYEEGLDILRNWHPAGPSRIAYEPRVASGCAATEAPRGLIYHRYGIDTAGKITDARIVPPTSQNQKQIEEDLREFLQRDDRLAQPDQTIQTCCEKLVRCYDPCISCSTHFLTVRVERR
jgi:coenzyme F420-reducing hydrogenase alpha subunit